MAINFGDDEIENVVETPEQNETPDASSLLSGYKDAKEETPPLPTTDDGAPVLPGDKPSADTTSAGGAENWVGDKRYFQTGPRAGQLRPNNGRRVRASIDTNAVTQISGSYLITASMFLTIIDMLFPMLIVGANNLVSDVKVELNQVRLKKDNESGTDVKKDLEPLAQATLKQLNLQGNPLLLLIITLSCNWTWNLIAARTMNQKDKQQKK